MPCSSGKVPKAVVTERNVVTTKILQENLLTIGSCHMPSTIDWTPQRVGQRETNKHNVTIMCETQKSSFITLCLLCPWRQRLCTKLKDKGVIDTLCLLPLWWEVTLIMVCVRWGQMLCALTLQVFYFQNHWFHVHKMPTRKGKVVIICLLKVAHIQHPSFAQLPTIHALSRYYWISNNSPQNQSPLVDQGPCKHQPITIAFACQKVLLNLY